MNKITDITARFRAVGLAIVVALLPVAAARADAGGPCGPAIAAAEARYSLPVGLLRAIAEVEAGRTDPRTGANVPWPWTTNAENQGQFFESSDAAVAWVIAAQARGVASIDVGCLQVNLKQHPDAFARIEDGFDPARNADYAARFLLRLRAVSTDWAEAVGRYHSYTEALAVPYRAQVARSYNGGAGARPDRIFAEAVMSERDRIARDLARAWAATMPSPAAPPHAPGWDRRAAAAPARASAAKPAATGAGWASRRTTALADAKAVGALQGTSLAAR